MSSPSVNKLCTSIAAIGCIAMGTGAIVASSCVTPQVYCTSAHGDFSVQFDLEDGDDEDECGSLHGDLMGLETFAAKADDGLADFSKASVAIKSSLLGTKWAYGVDHEVVDFEGTKGDLISLGKFSSSQPNENGFCAAKSLSDAEINVPEVEPEEDTNTSATATEGDDALDPGQVETQMTAAWSDFKVLITADAQGTQFSATLDLDWNECSATYKVRGVYPATGCDEDDDCGCKPNDKSCPGTKTVVNGDGEEEEVQMLGDKSGINPSFAVECDQDLGMCVLSKSLPAYE